MKTARFATFVKVAGSDSNPSGGPNKKNRSQSQKRYGRRSPVAERRNVDRRSSFRTVRCWSRCPRSASILAAGLAETRPVGPFHDSVGLGGRRLLERASLAARRLIRSRPIEQRADQSSDVAVGGRRISRGSASERPPAALGHAGRYRGVKRAGKIHPPTAETGPRSYGAVFAKIKWVRIAITPRRRR